MWVIQNQGLVRLPDSVPLPPDSVKVELPPDFHARPRDFKIEGNSVVRLSKEELKEIRQPRETLKLTQEEIAILKEAIAEGKYGTRKSKRPPSSSSR